ncbi:MAG: hypothetical protein R3E68_22105 [Burkholderiaceae bacterium]
MNPVRLRLVSLLLVTLSLASCGYGYISVVAGDCVGPGYPAVVAEFVDADSGRPVAANASGTVFWRGYAEPMVAWERTSSGLQVYSLAGGDSAGAYRVEIDAARAVGAPVQAFTFERVLVDADACGPFTVRLRVPLQRLF